MKVRQIMTKDLTAVEPNTSVKELIYILNNSGLSSLPVVDEDERIIGFISERDLIEAALPGYFEMLHETFLPGEKLSQKLKEIENQPVSKFMVKEVVKVEEDEDDLYVADLMIRKDLKMVPVINKDGILVGMVRRVDLLKSLL